MSATIPLGVSVEPMLAPSSPYGMARYLEEQVKERKDSVAAIAGSETITYGEIFRQALFLAGVLQQSGIRYGDRVGVLFPNHFDFIASFFAVTGLGAVVVPINPLLKKDEIAHILSDSNAKAILVHQPGVKEVEAALKGDGLTELTHILALGAHCQEAEQLNGVSLRQISWADCDLDHPASSAWKGTIENTDDLAILVYTSGTTGKPKGAMLSFANLFASIQMSHEVLEITHRDRFLCTIPLCHIYGLVVAMLGLLSKGGSLVLLDRFEPACALKLIEREKVTLLPAVPAMFQFMLMELEKNSYDLSSLRLCLSGASAMPVELFAPLERYFQATIVEGYGMTEVTAVATCNPIDGVKKRGSVGIPFPQMEIVIFDVAGNIMPPGSQNVGEIGIKGPNVMKGYFRRPQATSETIKDGWLLSGDLGYKDEDGYLFVVGRTKELIIRGGQNIYPREIEDLLMRLPQVAEVAVIGVPDQFMGERVKAVIALRQGAELTVEEVKEFCQKEIAEYKVPRLVEFVPALPRNSTGKILKRLLQADQ